MKSIISIVLVFLCLFSAQSQIEHPESFVYGEQGLNDYVITQVDSITKEVAYQKALNWVNKKYTNPNVVVTGKIEGEKIKINAVARKILEVRTAKSNLNYVIEITFKDNRYKFELLSLKYDGKTDYKKIANFKTNPILIKDFGNTPTNIEAYLNQLNTSLKNFILDIPEKSDDW